jgi:hypothetical protein
VQLEQGPKIYYFLKYKASLKDWMITMTALKDLFLKQLEEEFFQAMLMNLYRKQYKELGITRIVSKFCENAGMNCEALEAAISEMVNKITKTMPH